MNRMNCRISIIVPVYNAEKYLREAIESIINQIYADLELILIDDGSTDGSAGICDEYLYDNRVKVIHKENGGVQSARTAGLEAATGEYITFVDADDVLEKNAYAIVAEAINKYHADLVFFKHFIEYSKIQPEDSDDVSLSDVVLIDKADLYDNFMSGEYMGGTLWNKIWRRECLAGLQFRTDVQITEDAVYVWDSLKNVDSAVSICRKLYHYRVFQNNMTFGSQTDQYICSLRGWEYLKKEAVAVQTLSLKGICRNEIVWGLKALESSVMHDVFPLEVINVINANQAYFRCVSLPKKISLYLMNRSERLFKWWTATCSVLVKARFWVMN